MIRFEISEFATFLFFLAGWVLTCVASGMEACAHMAEDTKAPARTVPMAMFWSVFVSYAFGWVVSRLLSSFERLDAWELN